MQDISGFRSKEIRDSAVISTFSTAGERLPSPLVLKVHYISLFSYKPRVVLKPSVSS
jgi:hypothetical protein